MWGCDYGPVSSGWWGGFSPGGFFPGGILYLLIWGLIIFLLVYLGTRIYRSITSEKPSSIRDKLDSLAILKARFANGELSGEEYHKMKQVISGT
jgi:uncharacterized membrane protein